MVHVLILIYNYVFKGLVFFYYRTVNFAFFFLLSFFIVQVFQFDKYNGT